MYYKINVTLDNRHFFATAKHSIQTQAQFDNAIEIFKEKFPKNEGYEISATLVQETGTILEI